MQRKFSETLPAEQAKRFAETARQLGADEDESAFKAKLGMIARQVPKDEPAPAKPHVGRKPKNR